MGHRIWHISEEMFSSLQAGQSIWYWSGDLGQPHVLAKILTTDTVLFWNADLGVSEAVGGVQRGQLYLTEGHALKARIEGATALLEQLRRSYERSASGR